MDKSPVVSVIIPTKNEEENITRCLTSIKKQNYKDKIEIIVVDNASSDKTVKFARKFTYKVISAGHERSSQRNIGAKRARGEWLLFIDADMKATKNVIDECVRIAQASLNPPIIAINEISKGRTFIGKALALEENCYKLSPNWVQAARFFPRNYFLKFGGYDKSLVSGEDWDLTQRFVEKGIPMFLTKNSFLYHYESKASFFELLKKESYYIKHIGKYAQKHPVAFSYQGSILYRSYVWARSWHTLIKHPLLTTAFLWYKFVVWIMWQWYRKTELKF